MPRTIRVIYTNGVLKPLDELHLNEGEIIFIVIEKKSITNILDIIEELRTKTPKIANPVEVLEEMRR